MSKKGKKIEVEDIIHADLEEIESVEARGSLDYLDFD